MLYYLVTLLLLFNNMLPLYQFPFRIRRRNRADRQKKTAEQIERMKKKQREMEDWKERPKSLKPILIGLGLTVVFGGLLFYNYYWAS